MEVLRVTFCGVDESNTAEELLDITEHYPWVEFGVLFHPAKNGTPRYPDIKWVERLSKLAATSGRKIMLGAHLCGTRCEDVLNGDPAFVQMLASLGFQRVQVNATKANMVDTSDLASKTSNLLRVIRAVPQVEWILQKNPETQPLWEPILALVDSPANISILFDSSLGLGLKIKEFPSPSTVRGAKCGYAGGIGPANIDEVLLQLKASVPAFSSPPLTFRPPWVDMESSLRGHAGAGAGDDDGNICDLNKVRICIGKVKALADSGEIVLPPHPARANATP